MQVFADTGKVQQGTIAVHGNAVLYIPIDRVDLRVTSHIKGKSPQEAEQKGYQVGVKLKTVFKKFGITEKAIKKSKVGVHIEGDYYNRKKDREYVFDMECLFEFQQFDLIDTFREECIKAGAAEFSTAGFINIKR